MNLKQYKSIHGIIVVSLLSISFVFSIFDINVIVECSSLLVSYSILSAASQISSSGIFENSDLAKRITNKKKLKYDVSTAVFGTVLGGFSGIAFTVFRKIAEFVL